MSNNQQSSETLAWFESQILPLNSIMVPATDQTFEHGLGLFESLRAERGTVPLWPLHRQRLLESADQLRLPISVSKLPEIQDLQELVKQSCLADVSARLRLTLTGGSSTEACRLWVTAYPLGIVKTDGLTLADDFWPVDERDPLIRYKSLNYWLRRRAFEEAQAAGADEKLSQDACGQLWEGSRTSLFIVKNQSLIGPTESGPRLYSIASKALSDLGAEISFQKITTQMLVEADEVLLMNSLRGILTVGQWRGRHFASPGPVASSLRTIWRKMYF